jgi:NAD(P)-dependent dehydrogenase (short-subunit alcohol dehydrogenase family)
VRVNVLAPSGVYDGQEKGFVDEFKKRCPMQRMAQWDDYDGAIVFLASDASRYMTGSVLTVDGGWTAW